jgi:hypothetical protein
LRGELLTVALDEVAALDHEVLDDAVELAALVALRQPTFPASKTSTAKQPKR